MRRRFKPLPLTSRLLLEPMSPPPPTSPRGLAPGATCEVDSCASRRAARGRGQGCGQARRQPQPPPARPAANPVAISSPQHSPPSAQPSPLHLSLVSPRPTPLSLCSAGTGGDGDIGTAAQLRWQWRVAVAAASAAGGQGGAISAAVRAQSCVTAAGAAPRESLIPHKMAPLGSSGPRLFRASFVFGL